jgi:GntR family transcriptional regulator
MFRFRLDGSPGIPPYLQLVGQVRQALLLGYLREGDHLPAVKDVAADLVINPNTVVKAYRQLEHEGLTVGWPGPATFITATVTPLTAETQQNLRASLEAWLRAAEEAGLDDEAVTTLITAVRQSPYCAAVRRAGGEALGTAGPGDDRAAGPEGRGRLRASHADREHVIETLKAAFVQGRLTKDELDARVGQVFASRTYADLAAVTADIPAGLVAAQPPEPPRVPPLPPVVTESKTAARMIAAATAIPAALWAFVAFAPNRYAENGSLSLLFLALSSIFIWLIVLLLPRRR